MGDWITGYLWSWVWAYLAANWFSIALYLIVAALVCAALRKFMALYRGLPLAVGIVVLVVGAWTVGYRSGPVKIKTQVRIETRTETVEKLVPDEAAIARLRKQMADMMAEKDAAIARADAARRKAEAALAQLREELATANAEIQRLLAELAEKPQAPTATVNAMCIKCSHRMFIGSGMRNEQIRCHNCKTIMTAKSAWARMAYVLDRRR